MSEIDLYEQIAQWMNLKHPDVLYHFDLSGVWTPSHKQRNLYGRLNKRAWPDLFIAHPCPTMIGVKGLFLELKKDGVKLYKSDGTLRANPHHAEQYAMLVTLRVEGYMAMFAVGFDEATKIIDNYLSV